MICLISALSCDSRRRSKVGRTFSFACSHLTAVQKEHGPSVSGNAIFPGCACSGRRRDVIGGAALCCGMAGRLARQTRSIFKFGKKCPATAFSPHCPLRRRPQTQPCRASTTMAIQPACIHERVICHRAPMTERTPGLQPRSRNAAILP